MTEDQVIAEATEERTPAEEQTQNEEQTRAETFAKIAENVRTWSEINGAVMPVEELGPLFPDMAPEQIVQHLAEMVTQDEYLDIKLITSPNGATYLYSDGFLSAEAANDLVVAEEVQAKIASRVRTDSQESAKLTAVVTLGDVEPELSSERIEEYLNGMAGKGKYEDVKRLAGAGGVEYLYSETYMTESYARLLLRVEGKDPCRTIAETVREESRIYPRPTKVILFYEKVFGIPEDQMQTVVEQMLRQEEYKDVKMIVASTGAIYLHSDLYLSAPEAERMVYWEEVEQWTSP